MKLSENVCIEQNIHCALISKMKSKMSVLVFATIHFVIILKYDEKEKSCLLVCEKMCIWYN